MKKRNYTYTFKSILLFVFLAFSHFVYAQPGPGDLGSPPDLPGGGVEMGGSAPIDGGMELLLAFALFYVLYRYRKEIVLLIISTFQLKGMKEKGEAMLSENT